VRHPTRVTFSLFAGSLGLVAYAFVGYPAIIGLLARARPRPPLRDPELTPSVSLVIAAYNEAEVIEAKLADTATTDYPREQLEVIVVADGSDDGTEQRARGVPGVKVLHEPERRGKLAAIKRAAAAAEGEILVFTDANNRYSPNAVRELVAPFADRSRASERAGCAGLD